MRYISRWDQVTKPQRWWGMSSLIGPENWGPIYTKGDNWRSSLPRTASQIDFYTSTPLEESPMLWILPSFSVQELFERQELLSAAAEQQADPRLQPSQLIQPATSTWYKHLSSGQPRFITSINPTVCWYVIKRVSCFQHYIQAIAVECQFILVRP
jgi:hypothetical protein